MWSVHFMFSRIILRQMINKIHISDLICTRNNQSYGGIQVINDDYGKLWHIWPSIYFAAEEHRDRIWMGPRKFSFFCSTASCKVICKTCKSESCSGLVKWDFLLVGRCWFKMTEVRSFHFLKQFLMYFPVFNFPLRQLKCTSCSISGL